MGGVRAHIGAAVPAPRTLFIRGCRDLQAQAGKFGLCRVRRRRIQRCQCRRGGDQHEAQFVAELFEAGQQRGFDIQGHPGVQRAPQFPGRPSYNFV